jgi:hypothetical protein
MHTFILTWNSILSGAFASHADHIAPARPSKAGQGPTEFRIGGSEEGQALGVKVTLESAKDAARNCRESKAHGGSPSAAEPNYE